ncbi:MAG: serine/threonine-protein kinase [Gemmatimonadota bacterium]
MTELLDRLHAALTGVYALDRELGRGGMSTVFLARDLKHDRDVALKVLRPDLASAVGSERFLREIKVTASLNHPHILPLLDSGAIDELVYYVMPYVTGGSLRDRLISGGPFGMEEALKILGQVSAALDYAHRMEIVHRDIKPENILFSEGLAVVADFGIAQAVAQADRVTLTRTGYPVGTLGYMSPEQAAGRTDLDYRTDVFSLGAVAYEMLVGQTPDGWPAPEDSRLGRLTDAPPAHRVRLDAMPGRVEQALARALALRPSDRFASTGALHAALAEAAGERIEVSEEEMRQIFERAASPDAGEWIRGAPAEIGIPPERVREAALGIRREHAAPKLRDPGPVVPDNTGVTFQNSPDVEYAKNRLRAVRVLPVELEERDLPSLVSVIENELDLIGHASVVGRTLTWSPAGQGSEGRHMVVTVRPHPEGTQVHLEERLDFAGWKVSPPGLGAGAGMLLGAAAAAMFGLDGAAILALALPGGVLGAFMIVKGIENTMRVTRQPQMQRLLNRLSLAIGEHAGSRELPGTGEL